jgi:hypothetical protein
LQALEQVSNDPATGFSFDHAPSKLSRFPTEILDWRVWALSFRRVHADEPDALASSKHQCISVDDSLNIFKLARRYAWVRWIKEGGEERNENEARQRPLPVESAERGTRVHGDAFSTPAVKASRQTCGQGANQI